MRTMTRALALPAVGLLALGLTACGGASEDSSGSTGTVSDDVPSVSSEESQNTEEDTTNSLASKSDAAAPTQAPAKVDDSTTSTSAMKLEVGNCIADPGTTPGAGATVSKVETIDCNAPHLYEVFHNGDLTDATYPDDATMTEKSSSMCADAFTSFVGISYDASSYSITYLNPTPDSWKMGDRTVTCLITSADGSNLTGSAQGTNK